MAVIAQVARRPWHHDASTLVVEAGKIIQDTYGVETAITKLNQAYSIAEKTIPGLDLDNTIPLNVTVQLVNLLETPEFQCEYELLYVIAKTCRIFMDLTFVQAVQTHTPIRPDIHKSLKEKLEKVLKSVPEKKMSIRYELTCCWATALVLNDAVEYLKQFLLDHSGSIITAIVKQSPGDLVAPLKQALTDLWNLAETYWFNDVLSLHLNGKIEVLKFNFKDAADFGAVYNALSIKTYKRASITAHCVLSLLRDGMTRSIEAGNHGLQAKLLRGADSDTEPGFKHLAEYGQEELTDRVNSSWSVRCETIRFLFATSQKASLEENIWKFILTIIANKFGHKEHKFVFSFIRYILSEMKAQYNEKDLRPRIDYFMGEVRKIKDKGVSEDFNSLRRKREHLHTELTDQAQELNGRKDALNRLQVISVQESSDAEEKMKKVAEERKGIEQQIKALESTIEDKTTSLEEMATQEELLSLFQLQGNQTP